MESRREVRLSDSLVAFDVNDEYHPNSRTPLAVAFDCFLECCFVIV